MNRITTLRKPRKTRRSKPIARPVFDRVADAFAGLIVRLFAVIGAGFLSVAFIMLWPLRLTFIVFGAAAVGFMEGVRDEFRMIRQEWRADREERRRLGEIIETEWERLGLTSSNGRVRQVDSDTPTTDSGPLSNGAKGRYRELWRTAIQAIQRDRKKPLK